MEECYHLENRNPIEEANCVSRLFFYWMGRICYDGNKKGIEFKDIYATHERYKSTRVADRLEATWEKEIERGKLKDEKPNLLRALVKIFILEYIPWALLMFIYIMFVRSLQPLILAAFIRLFSNDDYTRSEVLIYGVGLCAFSVVSPFLNHHITCQTGLIGMRIRIAVSALVYRKIMKLSQLALSKTTTGQIINLLSNDVARFDMVVSGLSFLWIGPIQVLLVSYLIWDQVGPSSLAGIISLLVLTCPLQMVMASYTTRYRNQAATKTDNRVKIMNEILSGIQVIKMYGWETAFEKVIRDIREQEMQAVLKTCYAQGIIVSFLIFMEKATLAATIICFVILGNEINAALVFSLSMYFNLLQLTAGFMFPVIIALGAETLVAIKRLQTFLLLEEKIEVQTSSSKNNSISLRHVNATWVPSTPTLKDLNINLIPGSLCAVIGPVGSGKSSLLKVLLGELVTSSGSVEISGNISYASQEPWIFASTVRKNILFGEEYDATKYEHVVMKCALDRDFEQFPEGDRTRLGDRGVSLSGGQRARVNLARAVYKEADIYLLDDPLSAVDTNVGRHLFDECIIDHLKGKTRILVTHQLQYLKKADLIIVLNKGSIEAQGTFENLSKSNLDFTKLLNAADETEEDEQIRKKTKLQMAKTPTAKTTSEKATKAVDQPENAEEKTGFKGSAFWTYVKSSGNLSQCAFLVLLFILCQIVSSAADYWITLWTEQTEIRQSYYLQNSSATPDLTIIQNLHEGGSESEWFYKYSSTGEGVDEVRHNETVSFFQDVENKFFDHITVKNEEHILLKPEIAMYIYTIVIIATIVITLLRSSMYFYTCIKASKNLHNNMFHSLLETPMRFFDTNPTGRILNRFSKDTGAIDDVLPRSLVHVIQILLVMSGILVMVVISNPYLITVIIILATLFVKVRKWYIAVARELKLIEGIAKSPVFSFVTSTFDGLTTIRASKKEKILMKQFDGHQDVHTACWYLTTLCSSAFGLWLDIICAIFVCAVVTSFIILDYYINIGGSFIGLGISQSLILVGMLQFGMRHVSEVVNYITCVERVLEYTQLEKETPLYTPGNQRPKEPWPSQGAIIFHNITMKYTSTDPPVLKNLNLRIYPTEKIGIVGRTGAGKSSLIAALFRLAQTEGQILIDGIDTKTVGLRDLRKRISIIPQQPALFSASVRYNLDPFNEYDDKELWEVLGEVELKDKVQSLDFMVTGGGANFSVGQRQLICLARAILRNNKILILDEATANVDLKTDEVMQKTVRQKFENCTVLTIAHRLNTIMDSDKVLVMDNGCAVEFDHPHLLLQNIDGYFSKMLLETGQAMTQALREVALASFQSRISMTPL